MNITRTVTFPIPGTMESLLIALQRLAVPGHATLTVTSSGMLNCAWDEQI